MSDPQAVPAGGLPEPDQKAVAAVSFKKRKGARKGKSRTPLDEILVSDGAESALGDGEVDSEEQQAVPVDPEASRKSIEVVKAMQEFRRRDRLRRGGLTLNSSQSLEEQLLVMQGKDPESLYSDDRVTAAELTQRVKIGTSFREGGSGDPGRDEKDAIAKQMEAYIAEKLAERLAASGAGAAAPADSAPAPLLPEPSDTRGPLSEDDLFEQLLTHREREQAINPESETAKIDSLESGDRWLTGIQEINLPLKYKLENIERTERAKQHMLTGTAGSTGGPGRSGGRGGGGAGQKRTFSQQQQQHLEQQQQQQQQQQPAAPPGPDLGPDMRIQDLPSNFNADFKRHKREWFQNLPDTRHRQMVREREQAQRGGDGGSAEGGERPRHNQQHLPRWQQASDDRVVSRFVKQQRAKFKW